MGEQALAVRNGNGQSVGQQIEQVLIKGDLAGLSPEQRVQYYNAVCQSVGLNPLTRPFDYIRLNGKEVLYAKRDCTDQLRRVHGVSIKIVSREAIEGVYVVTAQATDKTGRVDESTGAVPIEGLKGETRANALMKCETKAKRRVTLSICGLGLLDETEVDSVPGAQYVAPVSTTGATRDGRFAVEEDEVTPVDDGSIEMVPVYDVSTSEQIGSRAKASDKQLEEIKRLRGVLRNNLSDATFRKRLIKTFSKESVDLLATDEAAKVIGTLLAAEAKQQGKLETAGEGTQPTAPAGAYDNAPEPGSEG